MLVLLHTPSSHLKLRADRSLCYQRSAPAQPVWLLAVFDPASGLAVTRFVPKRLGADDLAHLVQEMTGPLHRRPSGELVVARALRQQLPLLAPLLERAGFELALPAVGSPFPRLSSRVHAWFCYLTLLLDGVFEGPPTCEELNTLFESQGLLVKLGALRGETLYEGLFQSAPEGEMLPYDMQAFVASLVRARGRDPEEGRERRRQTPPGAKLNSVSQAARPPQQPLLDQVVDKLARLEERVALAPEGYPVLRSLRWLQHLRVHERHPTSEELWGLGLVQYVNPPQDLRSPFVPTGRWGLSGELPYDSDPRRWLDFADRHYACAPAWFEMNRWGQPAMRAATLYVVQIESALPGALHYVPRPARLETQLCAIFGATRVGLQFLTTREAGERYVDTVTSLRLAGYLPSYGPPASPATAKVLRESDAAHGAVGLRLAIGWNPSVKVELVEDMLENPLHLPAILAQLRAPLLADAACAVLAAAVLQHLNQWLADQKVRGQCLGARVMPMLQWMRERGTPLDSPPPATRRNF